LRYVNTYKHSEIEKLYSLIRQLCGQEFFIGIIAIILRLIENTSISLHRILLSKSLLWQKNNKLSKKCIPMLLLH
jgi:hypothetical protein